MQQLKLAQEKQLEGERLLKESAVKQMRLEAAASLLLKDKEMIEEEIRVKKVLEAATAERKA